MCLTFLYSLSAWSQTKPCGTDEYMQALFAADEDYATAFEAANQQINDAIDANPNIGELEFVIPVVVHIMHNETEIGVNENIPDEQIEAAINLLNNQFAGGEGDGQTIFETDTGIQFRLAQLDPDCGTTDGIVRVPTDSPFGSFSNDVIDVALKNQSRWPVQNYLNIWVVESAGGGTPAYAVSLPNDPKDGVVIRFDYFGDTDAIPEGRETTLAHEVGHYLSLLHPWGDSVGGSCEGCHNPDEPFCRNAGDFVCDTAPCFGPLNDENCDQIPDARCIDNCNTNPQLPYPKESYMSYEQDCHTGFSPRQAQRMCAAIDQFRQELVSLSNAAHTGILESILTYQNYNVWWNTAWNTEGIITINGNLTIRSGRTLTVNPGVVVMFGPNSKVIVERGARLIMNGSTFTAQCDGTWRGIQVLGNKNQGQNTTNQGFISLTNNATIQHADIGIFTGNRDDFYSTTGGIVQAANSNFINNRVDVEFRAYKNTHPISGVEVNNASWFENCESHLTDLYRFPFDDTDTGMQGFFRLRGVNGVAISGHHFEDQRMILDAERPSGKIGIESFKSGFSVDEWCEGPPTFPKPFTCDGNRTQFIDLGYGIAAAVHTHPSFPITINNSDFDCWHGIHALGISNEFAIQLNNFNVKERTDIPDGNAAWNFVPSYGIHLDNSINYTVQNNNFVSEVQFGSPGSGDETAGIVVRNNHGNSEEIYNNRFEDMNIACEAIARNRGTDLMTGNDVGLEFRCNHFRRCRVDMYVSPEVNPNLTPATLNGILPIQNLPANLFSPNHLTMALNIFNAAGAAPLTYNHHSIGNNSRVKPAFVNNGVTVNNQGIAYNVDDACPNFLSDGMNERLAEGEALTTLRTTRDDRNHLLQSTSEALESMMDNGNTALLLAAVNHPNTQRSLQAYTNIINQAPFTSDEVLEAVSKKETGWSRAMVRNVLAAHPQAAKSETVQQNLDNRSNLLPPFMRNQINAGLNTIGEKEQMELTINRYRRERNLAIRQAVAILAADTIDRTTEMIDLFANTRDIQYEYRLAEAYDALDNREQAEEVLNNISLGSMSEAAAQAHADYMSFRQLRQTWINQNKDLADLAKNDIELLHKYGQRANTTAGHAIALLRLNGINTYREPVYFPDEIAQLRVAQHTEEIINQNKLLIYPNPANDYVTIDYTVSKSDAADLSILITDILGQQVYQEKLSYPQDEVIIMTNQLPQGQYFCILKDSNEVIKTDKFIVTK